MMVSEDCLYLNIWAPLKANQSTSYPVFVFIHGGDFVGMASSSPLFDAENITFKGEVITVTMDYRLGALGFLVTSDTQNGEGSSGNFGILDQRLALKWVTVGGQSAGAQSTVIHLMKTESSQYFRRAIIQSAPFSLPFRSRDEALFLGDLLAEELKSMGTILAIKNTTFFDKPILIGTVTEETRIYIYTAWKTPLSVRQYIEVLVATFLLDAEEVLLQYPSSSSEDQRDTLVQLGTDFLFTCSTRNYTRNILDKGNTNIYHYIYNHAFSFPGWGQFKYCDGHVCHGSELPFLFQTKGNFTITPDEGVLSEALLYYWTNFIKNGNPNMGHGVDLTWPPYLQETDWNYMLFETPKRFIGSHYRSDQCLFWDKIGYKA
ncbi:hypothetical protein KUTeg_015375 [Tegillarca granosa]|uniref:Carboxylesterase type B domain-containing protein n=1 Tax=Tegillarca granosa TaxID=220873 RepID=A0ABQ9ESC5_TEGGR|nr:hypothetical protein KUTeg_015375 [Tegillarca granosa]